MQHHAREAARQNRLLSNSNHTGTNTGKDDEKNIAKLQRDRFNVFLEKGLAVIPIPSKIQIDEIWADR